MIYNEINYIVTVFKENQQLLKVEEIRQIVVQCASNLLSLENFVNELLKYRFTYRDIVEPLLSNLMEYLYGFKLQLDVLKHISAICLYGSQLQSNLEKLIQFPTLDKNQQDYLAHIDSYLNNESIYTILKKENGENSSQLQRFK